MSERRKTPEKRDACDSGPGDPSAGPVHADQDRPATAGSGGTFLRQQKYRVDYTLAILRTGVKNLAGIPFFISHATRGSGVLSMRQRFYEVQADAAERQKGLASIWTLPASSTAVGRTCGSGVIFVLGQWAKKSSQGVVITNDTI